MMLAGGGDKTGRKRRQSTKECRSDAKRMTQENGETAAVHIKQSG
jgi:hypothetical protein